MPLRGWGFLALLLLLAGCAAPAPPSAAATADANTCTAQADAVYQQENVDALSRTSQNGLYFGNTPTHVFDAQRMGSMHQRDSAITNCEDNGNSNLRPAYGSPLVTPHIVTN